MALALHACPRVPALHNRIASGESRACALGTTPTPIDAPLGGTHTAESTAQPKHISADHDAPNIHHPHVATRP